MSHVGMCPHFMHQYGGFKLQGRTAKEPVRHRRRTRHRGGRRLRFRDRSGACECGEAVDAAVDIFTFGIGAGPASCGNSVAFDLLGVFDQFKPKFTKRYANLSEIAVAALKQFALRCAPALSRRRPQLRHEDRGGSEAFRNHRRAPRTTTSAPL